MGFNFSFFGDSEHRVFNYKPRYYDPEKEARRRMFGNVDGSNEKASKEGEKYVPGKYIYGSLRDGNYQVTRSPKSSKAQKIIGLIGLLLFFVIMYLIAKFYSSLF